VDRRVPFPADGNAPSRPIVERVSAGATGAGRTMDAEGKSASQKAAAKRPARRPARAAFTGR
jgi:hypothetical protein